MTLIHNDDHFNVDHDKSKDLEQNTGPQPLYESCRYHCRKVLVIRSDSLFNLFHAFLLKLFTFVISDSIWNLIY